jgi:hypothetical protein
MTTPPRSSPATVGRFTGFVLGLVVFVCVTMIGCAGYLKYELDRAEAVLAAPEAGIGGDAENIDRLRRSLGYSGFVGSAQTFVATHDNTILSDMKTEMKTANDIVAHMPDRTSNEARHDLQSILATFEAVRQKAEKASVDLSATFTATDLTPLYAALPVLDARITSAAAVNRFAAQGQLQFWAMLLTFVSWASLIIAAAMAAGFYISLRDRNSAPMRALAQSVKNMAHGDMRTSIWGMERSDMIGELARAVDIARYHFSQLPDMSLLSDQGPVRIRFEGNTRSMFEAMMKVISKDSEDIRSKASTLAQAITVQQQAIDEISSQIKTVLNDILQRGHDGNLQVKHVLDDMRGSSLSLKHAQEHASDQLNRIIPHLQERANGLAEITQLTGKQVSQVLQSLMLSERGLKNSAEQSDLAIKKLSSTADDMGERLFGAVNLLQASGKVLAETTESTQSRLNKAIERLNDTIPGAAPAEDGTLVSSIPRIESLVASLEAAQAKLSTVLDEQTQAAKAQIELLATHSSGLLTQTTTTAQTLASAADHLRSEQTKFDDVILNMSDKINAIGERLEQHASDAFGKVENTAGETAAIQAAAQTLASAADDLRSGQIKFDNVIENIGDKINTISERLERHASDAFGKAESAAMEAAGQNREETNHRLIEIALHIQRMDGKLADLASKQDAASVLQIPPMPSVDNHLLLDVKNGFDGMTRNLSQMRDQLSNIMFNVQTQLQAATLGEEAQLNQLSSQLDATRDQLSQLIMQHTNRIESPETATAGLSREAQDQMEQQTQILTELVATLGLLDAHMQQIKSDMHAMKA